MNYIAKLINLIYPIKCAECGSINKKYLCTRCRARLGLKLKIHICKYKNKKFNKHIFLFKYENNIRDKIIKYKFREKAYLYKLFSELILETNIKKNFLKSYDYIVPIPISRKRKKQRGYNQSELIAKEISKNIETLKYVGLILKKKENKVQSTLNKKERAINVKGVYEISEKELLKCEDIENKKVIIIDDIYTTGATANEAAKVLYEHGIKNIDVFTIAKD